MITITNDKDIVTIVMGNYTYKYRVPRGSGANIVKQRQGEDILDICMRVTKAGTKISAPPMELWTTPAVYNKLT